VVGRYATGDVRYNIWNGNTFIGDPSLSLESSLEEDDMTFDIAESGVTYTGGSG